MSSKSLKSCAGIVIYRISSKGLEFLLTNDSFSNHKHWTPVKGPVKPSEDLEQCAIRETLENLALQVDRDYQMEKPFAVQIKYLSGFQPKEVTYYLASLNSISQGQSTSHAPRIATSSAGLVHNWFTPSQAHDRAVYKSMQTILQLAKRHLEDKYGTEALVKSLPLNLSKLTVSDKPKNQRRSPSPRKPDTSPSRKAESKKLSSNPLYKTRLCEKFEKDGVCPYPQCIFAHGVDELRDRATHLAGKEDEVVEVAEANASNPLYKTKLCEKFESTGFCGYGPMCNYAHGKEELRVNKVKKKKAVASNAN